MARVDPLEDVVSILLAAGPWTYGKEADLTLCAESWLAEGFSPQEVHDWIEAGCFGWFEAATLKKAGVIPDKAAQVALGVKHTRTSAKDRRSIGYLVSMGEITIEEALQQVGTPAEEDW